nr:glycosyltransferase family 4 protein [Sphingomonas quercus]
MSGGDRVIAIYARQLHERGHSVSVVCQPPREPTLRQRFSNLRHGRKFVRKSPEPYYAGSSVTPRMIDRHRPIVAADLPDADVVIGTWWETAEWVAALPASKGSHAHFIQHYEAMFDERFKDRVDAVLRQPSFKITISKWLDDLLRDKFGNQRVAMIPNSVDMTQFNAAARGRHSPPTVGLLYSPTPWKNCEAGIRAFEALRRRLPGVRLRTFGAIDPTPALPLPEGTIHTTLPPQDTIRDIYAECDAWLCMSRGEGFHLPPLEAMACRCPVVSTPVGGPIDIIREGENGFIVPFDDAEAAASRLEQMLSGSEADWRRMSDAAYATATSYSWNDAATLFEAALVKAQDER